MIREKMTSVFGSEARKGSKKIVFEFWNVAQPKQEKRLSQISGVAAWLTYSQQVGQNID